MKSIAAIAIFVTLSLTALSQTWKRNRIEVFIGIPTTQYFGDIGGTADKSNAMGLKDISLKSIRPGILGGATYQYSDKICFNAKLTTAIWTQTDIGSRNENRGNAFSTFGTEISINCMYFLLSNNNQSVFHNISQLRGGMNRRKEMPISLYVFTGLGANIYFVKAKDNLTNDSRFDDSQKVTLLIPIGLGAKYQLRPQLAIGVELGGRFLFTDKFDGLTTKYSEANDVYYITSISLHYRLLKNNTFKHSRRSRFFF